MKSWIVTTIYRLGNHGLAFCLAKAIRESDRTDFSKLLKSFREARCFLALKIDKSLRCQVEDLVADGVSPGDAGTPLNPQEAKESRSLRFLASKLRYLPVNHPMVQLRSYLDWT